MSSADTALARRYDAAAPGWADKMRALGYYDGYLGFLSAPDMPAPEGPAHHVVDMGAGTAAFAEAWVAVRGAPDRMTLVEPAPAMLARGAAALARRQVTAETRAATLEGAADLAPASDLLAAHLIEHLPEPRAALSALRARLAPGGRLWLVASKPHWCNAIIWLKWGTPSFPPDRIAALLADSGFALSAEYAFPAGPPSRTSRGYLAIRA
ncbi:MAG: methyltransferase [Pseudomonadota bacterium]